jgi:4-alpha-glucanotransferase
MPLVAEDLGIITAEVNQLRQEFHLPGMKILQFAFGDDHNNPYLPCNYTQNSVVYTGTHDNDTSLGWYTGLSKTAQQRVHQLLDVPATATMPEALIEAAMASVSDLAIIPMQDLLGLGSNERMNIPGTMCGNWQWRFQWPQLSPEKIDYLTQVVKQSNR